MIKGPTSLVREYTYISKLDDAVDRPEEPADKGDADALKSYEKALADFEHRWEMYLDGAAPPPLKADGRPTVFHLRTLRAGEVDWLTSSRGTSMDAAAVALVRVENLDVSGWSLKHKTNKDGLKVANLDEAPDFLWIVFADVGQRVTQRTNVSPK